MPQPQLSSPTRSIGIAGWEHLDLVIVSALASGLPILFVGGHGAAKTEGARALAAAILGDKLRWANYECPSVQMDDIIGFPDVAAVSRGTMAFAGLPMSIWNVNAVVFDELTRASPTTAAKYLELIRTRKVYGIETPLEHVFSTANPPSRDYPEVHKIGLAMASRFVCVPTPRASELSEDEIVTATTSTLEGVWSWWPLAPALEPMETILDIRKVCARLDIELTVRQLKHLRALLGVSVAAAAVGCRRDAETLTTLVRSCIPEASGLCARTCDTTTLNTTLLAYFEEYLQTQMPPPEDWPAYFAAVSARIQVCGNRNQAAVLEQQLPILKRMLGYHDDDVQKLLEGIVPLLLKYPSDTLAATPLRSIPDLLAQVLS